MNNVPQTVKLSGHRWVQTSIQAQVSSSFASSDSLKASVLVYTWKDSCSLLAPLQRRRYQCTDSLLLNLMVGTLVCVLVQTWSLIHVCRMYHTHHIADQFVFCVISGRKQNLESHFVTIKMGYFFLDYNQNYKIIPL